MRNLGDMMDTNEEEVDRAKEEVAKAKKKLRKAKEKREKKVVERNEVKERVLEEMRAGEEPIKALKKKDG